MFHSRAFTGTVSLKLGKPQPSDNHEFVLPG